MVRLVSHDTGREERSLLIVWLGMGSRPISLLVG